MMKSKVFVFGSQNSGFGQELSVRQKLTPSSEWTQQTSADNSILNP